MFFLIVQHSQWFCHCKKRFGLALLILTKLTLLFLVNLTNKPKWMDFSTTPILILFILCAPAFSRYGKQIAFRELTVEDGLSQNSVVSIAQDTTGYMWFATQDGLNKYNGNTFLYYDVRFEDVTRPTFSKLGKIYVAKNGDIWVISIGGKLQKYDVGKESFQYVPMPQ